MLRKFMFVWVTLLFAIAWVRPAFANSDDSDYRNAVYVMTNRASGNQILAYHRDLDGELTLMDTYDTGGQGSGVGVTVPADPLGSQNSLLLSSSGKWLFAVNAGSDEITVFKAKPDGLEWMDKVSSGGDYPVSLSFDEEHLYVLNAGGDGNITGFELDEGKLVPLEGSTNPGSGTVSAIRPSSTGQINLLNPTEVTFSPDTLPLDMGVSRDGEFLYTLNVGAGSIGIFGINEEGQLDSIDTIDGLPKLAGFQGIAVH